YHTPAQAAKLGIGMLYQEPLDFPPLTVLDNFMIGQARGIKNRKNSFRKEFNLLVDHFNFTLNADGAVEKLTIGERQQLEILRLLALGAKVLILDEPTTGISREQKESLFDALKKLASEGKSVLLVSHKLRDAEALCDTVTVLREGVVTGSVNGPYDAGAILEMMFGVPPGTPSRSAVEYGKTILSMNEVSGSGGRSGLSNCTVSIKQGEMVGLAGLGGSGQEVFLRLAGGITKPSMGSIELMGKEVQGQNLHAFKKACVVFLPASRLEEGLMPGLTITEHFALQDQDEGFVVKWHEASETAQAKIKRFRVMGTPESVVESLSGGNQQRLLLSLLSKDSKLLLLEHPTRGLDVESANWVWWHLHKYCLRKTSVVFSSSDLDEIFMVADRILVFFDGRIVKDARKEETDIDELTRAIVGKAH
ncbi:MAG: ATP-binding cassette domain-containing protein, partial [Candidatus Altiarchaeota archaeon]|nr:ATP-binding cassette domain-containing protein [Candidatus Altiarchaeota archaeon]